MSYSLTLDWPEEQIAVVRFADPLRNNQICWAAVDELGERLQACRESGARVVILASDLPGHWLQHAWLRDLVNGVDGAEQTGSGMGWFVAQKELGHPEMISIAAISGDCSGGGAELGWSCDLRIAETQATFCQLEVNLGLTTGIGGCSRLAQLAGRAMATEMALTGQKQSAQRLHDLGAVNKVVPTGQSLSSAMELARTLVEKSPLATAGIKRILAAGDEHFLAQALEQEQQVFQSVVVTEQAKQAMLRQQQIYDEN